MPFDRLMKRLRDRIACYLPLPAYYGKDFRRIYAFLLKSRYWSREEILAYKLERIQALLQHAQAHVPYYRDLFQRLGIDSTEIKTYEDFSKFPVLSKDTVRNCLHLLKSDTFDSFKPVRTQTSGTTSSMTLVYRSAYQEAFRRAQLWRFYNEHGHHFRDRWVNIVCNSFDPNSPVIEHNRLENCLIINTYQIIRGKRDEILDAIEEFRPNLIWAHPSPLAILAEHLLSNGRKSIKVPLVATFAEKIYPHVRRVLEEAFPGQYIDYLGNRENSVAAWGHSNDQFYEVSEYCHIEVDNHGPDGVTGDLISTSLHNYACPLIRYDSGDVIRWLGYTDPKSPYPMFELLGGRGKDVLVTRNGLTVPYFLAYIEKKNFDKLAKYQMEQVDLDEIILRIVPRANFVRETDEPLLLEYASKSLADQFKIRLEYVDDIPLTDGGKYRPVISKPALEYFDKKYR